MTPATTIEIPTFSECVIGYRQWRIDALGRLRPITAAHLVWTPGVNEAACEKHVLGGMGGMVLYSSSGYREELEPSPQHVAPDPRCRCGLYAYHRPPARSPFPPDDQIADGIPVFGAIAAFGRLQVYHHGFRAQRAGCVALALPRAAGSETRARVAEVAERYRVRLVDLEEIEEEASRHGTPLPDSMLPPKPVLQQQLYAQVAINANQFQQAMAARSGFMGRVAPQPRRRSWAAVVAKLVAVVVVAANAIVVGPLDLGWAEWPEPIFLGLLLGALLYRTGRRRPDRNGTAAEGGERA